MKNLGNKNNFVGDVGDVGDVGAVQGMGAGKKVCTACDGNYARGCPHCNPKAYGAGV